MLAARDQENLVHAHQSTAAGKPLNQGIRALQPKTPGMILKTPFRPTKNDENRNLTLKGAKTGLDKNAFVTPAGPRTRAPLGAKTTNAKAQQFKTPTAKPQNLQPLNTARQSSARRSLKSRITIAPSEPVEADVLAQDDDDDDLPEPEYAPPNPIELLDPPLEIPYNQDYPMLQGMNLMRGYGKVYGSPTDESGMSLRLKRQEEIKKQFDHDMDKNILDMLKDWPDPNENDKQAEAMIEAGPKARRPNSSAASTINAKAAASALSQTRPVLSNAAAKSTPNTLQKQRKPAFNVHGANKTSQGTISAMRSNAAAAISKNTIGYPKAKKPASIIPSSQRSVSRPPPSAGAVRVDQSKIHPKDFVKLYGTPPFESDMWFRLKEHELIEESTKDIESDNVADDLFSTDFFPIGEEGDDEDVFQLPIP